MKKLTFIIALMLMSLVGMAQEESKTSPKIGIRFGYNLSTINKFLEFNDDDYKEWKSGINFGVVSDFQLTNKVVFRPGLYYSTKGMDCGGDKFRYNYLEAPLLAVFQQPLGHKLKLELQAGPYFGVGICGKSDLSLTSDFKLNYNTFGGDNGARRFDWGLNLGLGLHIDKIYLGASFEDGFRSLGRNNMTHCLMANVGYSF